MKKTQAVGIDLGTTYSCIAHLNEHGEPATIPNQEGELSTPSAVLFDGAEAIVGTEALRNTIVQPQRVIVNSKRWIGDTNKRWLIDGRPFTPTDIATYILKKLLNAAEEKLGKIEQAVITVPAQFSDAQRKATVDAGLRAGLTQVDIINEPVAAALCHVLGTEGIWFSELAEEQRIMVFDLGGGTFDLSLVNYKKNEVTVIASSGDLHLGGIDWNDILLNAIAGQFKKEYKNDPRKNALSLQALAIEVEQAKRSLSVRPRTALTCQHQGDRRTYQVEQLQFENLTEELVNRTEEITLRMLKENKMGWAHVDAVLTTGGASRMPMIRDRLKKLSGRTLNTSLSPDQSIAHGATYYAGMVLSNSKFARSILNKAATERLSQVKQISVNARGLGILVRDPNQNDTRVPHYLIPANTPLPTSITHSYGTVVKNQKRVHLNIVESGTGPEKPLAKLGACSIHDLPADLPEGSEIAVTIRYDVQARVHVSAKDVTSGKVATTEIIREENLTTKQSEDFTETDGQADLKNIDQTTAKSAATKQATHQRKTVSQTPQPQKAQPQKPRPRKKASISDSPSSIRKLSNAERPIPLCNDCGEPLNVRGECDLCRQSSAQKARRRSTVSTAARTKQKTSAIAKQKRPAAGKPAQQKPARRPKRQAAPESDAGEEEFWNMSE